MSSHIIDEMDSVEGDVFYTGSRILLVVVIL